ncbi:MAG: YitT family protein [Clostridia bacterium]|nr:YitT family protein [Clostridia bacterium]
MKKRLKTPIGYSIIVFAAIILAFNYYIFIVKNNFAPAGLNGIAVMIQYKTGFSISYMSLLINIPLCLAAFFMVSRRYAVRTLVFVVVYSVVYFYLQEKDYTFFQYNARGHDTIFPCIISGVITGVVSGVCLKFHSSTGGTEIISKYINKIKPTANFFLVYTILNAFVAVASLFVYSEDYANYKPVALCLTYCFISGFVGNYIIKGTKTAYKFTVITTHPDEISKEILSALKHGVTKIAASGEFTKNEKAMLICVVSKHQLIDFKNIIDSYDDTFSFCETVNQTFGNFQRR